MLYSEIIAVCSQIHTKHKYTVWAEHSILYVKRAGMRVFENRVLRRICGPKRDEITGEWRRLLMI
jgi:hypothetical protein